jgi:hypothetical protein
VLLNGVKALVAKVGGTEALKIIAKETAMSIKDAGVFVNDLVRGRGFGNVRASSKTTTSINKVKQIDRWSRTPKSIQDRLALEAAKKGEGTQIIADNLKKLNDSRYKGMKKWEYKTKSKNGNDSVVHYVKDPKTGKLMDFKFKKHSTGEIPK